MEVHWTFLEKIYNLKILFMLIVDDDGGES